MLMLHHQFKNNFETIIIYYYLRGRIIISITIFLTSHHLQHSPYYLTLLARATFIVGLVLFFTIIIYYYLFITSYIFCFVVLCYFIYIYVKVVIINNRTN